MKFNKVISFGVALALMFGVSACKSKEESSKRWDTSKIVAMVGDDNIYDSEFKFYFNLNKQQMESNAGLENKSDEEKKKFWESQDGNEDKKQKLIDKTFDDLVDLKVLLKLAKKEDVKLDQDDLTQIERNIYSFIKERGNENLDEAESLMKEMYGITIDEYRWIYQDYLTAYNKYAYNETENIQISDSEIEERFERDKDDFKKVDVRHVLLYTIDVDTQQPLEEDAIKEKRHLAEDILKRVKEGESIEDLAKEYSEDTVLKNSGGEEILGKGDIVPEFEDWLFNAKEGEVGLIETSYGFHIAKVIKTIDASLGDKERNTIGRYLKNEKFTEKLEKVKEKNPLVKNKEVLDSLELF